MKPHIFPALTRTPFLAPLLALCLLAAPLPAQAHLLKVFATVEGDTVRGYAFFVGGGRAMGTDWKAVSAQGEALGSGKTGDDGGYSFAAPAPAKAPVTITVDTHEGHIAKATLGPERFGPPAPAAARPAPTQAQAQAQAVEAAKGAISGAAIDAAGDDARIAAQVEAAVARQITPLAEQIEALQNRLRFADILSALFLIGGLAGAALWLRGRRGA